MRVCSFFGVAALLPAFPVVVRRDLRRSPKMSGRITIANREVHFRANFSRRFCWSFLPPLSAPFHMFLGGTFGPDSLSPVHAAEMAGAVEWF